MGKDEFVESMTYLGLAFNKTFTKNELILHYDFLKEYDDEIFTKAVKNIIKKSKFLPKINELIEECEAVKKENKLNILETMKNDGYFKNEWEYEKVSKFLKSGIIPEWFNNDMNNYKKSQLENSERLYLK